VCAVKVHDCTTGKNIVTLKKLSMGGLSHGELRCMNRTKVPAGRLHERGCCGGGLGDDEYELS
jgi:hypothetical protein